jgi:hypothetical protein
MPRFQLQVAVLSVIGAACSLTVFYLARPEEGKIKLPHTEQDEFDPFDVTRPEDLVDGYPIDEQAFWFRVCIL